MKGSYRDLIAWQKAMDLAARVYEVTTEFPRDERFGLVAQLRSSAVSVPSNIAEGHGRITRGEWQQFLGFARGSVLELQTQLILSDRLGFAKRNDALDESEEVGRVLNGLLSATFRRPPRKPN